MPEDSAALDRPDRIAEAIEDAAALGAEDRWPDALARLRDTLAETGDDATLLGWLTIAADRDGRTGEAYEYARRCLLLNPEDPFVLASAGEALAAFDDPDAERVLRLAAMTAPDHAFARAAYGSYLAREGLAEEALNELRAARELTPEDASVWLDTGIALLSLGRADEAADALEEAYARTEDDPWTRALLGLARVAAGEVEAAAEDLRHASLFRPADAEIHVASALAACAAGWEGESSDALDRAREALAREDEALLIEAEDSIEDGPEAAEAFLRAELVPALLRERMWERG